MTENAQTVLEFLKRNYGKEFTKNEIAEKLKLSLPAVTGSINGLRNKGYVEERIEEVEVEPATETRKAKIKTTRYEKLTEAGLSYDPIEEDRLKAEAKAKAKAEREAAKAKAE